MGLRPAGGWTGARAWGDGVGIGGRGVGGVLRDCVLWVILGPCGCDGCAGYGFSGRVMGGVSRLIGAGEVGCGPGTRPGGSGDWRWELEGVWVGKSVGSGFPPRGTKGNGGRLPARVNGT